MRVVEAEEPRKQEVDLVGEPRQKLYALIRRAVVAVGSGAEREHHNERRYNEHAGNDGYADVYTGASAVEKRVERAQEQALLLFLLLLFLNLMRVAHLLFGILRVCLQNLALHEAGGHDAADKGSEEAYQRLDVEALPHHEHHDEQTHTEGRAEVGERDKLIFLEITAEALVLRQRDDGRIVRQEGHYGYKQAAYGARDDADAHEIKHGVEQKVVGGLHYGVKHIGHAHY